jgi:hypothetical protein
MREKIGKSIIYFIIVGVMIYGLNHLYDSAREDISAFNKLYRYWYKSPKNIWLSIRMVTEILALLAGIIGLLYYLYDAAKNKGPRKFNNN